MKPFLCEFIEKHGKLVGPILELGSRERKERQKPEYNPIDFWMGFDISRGKNVTVQVDGEALPLKDKSVGSVICMETLEQCWNPTLVIAEIGRVLKRTGDAYLSFLYISPTKHQDQWLSICFPQYAPKNDKWRFFPRIIHQMLSKNQLRIKHREKWVVRFEDTLPFENTLVIHAQKS